MLSRKRVSLLLAVGLLVSLVTAIATTLSRGETTGSVNRRIKVLRRKDQLKLKPRAEEIAAFQEGRQERTFKSRDFKDIPVAIRQVRNLQSDTWHTDLEIEIKNVSTRPIYFILAYLQFPDVPVPADGVYGITLEYGERRNIDYRKNADPQDPHLNPGDRFIFTIPENMRKSLRIRHERTPELMRKLDLHFGVISFGDGTGFVAERLRNRGQKKAHSGARKNHHSVRSETSFRGASPTNRMRNMCALYIGRRALCDLLLRRPLLQHLSHDFP